MRRFALTHLAPAALLLALVVVPLATGARTLFLRDTLLTHLSMREGLARAIRAGDLPMIDPLRGGGQALVGNLNAVALYPDNLLLLASSTLWQLNAHFWIHWILAFAAAFWLARALRWGAPAAAMTGAAYAFSGFFLSQLNLYNGIAPAALAPALAAAAIQLVRGENPRRSFLALALLWTLSILGGDPILAGLALVMAILLSVYSAEKGSGWPGRGLPHPRDGGPQSTATSPEIESPPLADVGSGPDRTRGRTLRRGLSPWLYVAAAIALGTALAAPQILATQAILAESSRGFRGFDARDLPVASPEPAAALDLLLPLFFGRPDAGSYWGNAYFGDTPALYFSLAPGAIALALVWVGLRRGRRDRLLPLALVAVGTLLTYSSGTVLSQFVASIPGMSLVRFQAKFALLLALGIALLAGLGAERLAFVTEARTNLRRALAAQALVLLGVVALCAIRPRSIFDGFLAIFGAGLAGAELEFQVLRWAGIALLTLFGLALVLAATAPRLQRFEPVLPVAIAVQVALQLLLLRGIFPTDAAAPYRAPPPVFAAVPADGTLVHGAVNGLFGTGLMESPGEDSRLAAQVRRAWQSGFTLAAHLAGRRTELDSSPEGLDHFTLLATEDAVESLTDRQRIRVLRATGVGTLLLPRELNDVPEVEARAIWHDAELRPPLTAYAIADGRGEAVLARCIFRAPHMNAALARLLADDFDPRREAVIPGSGASGCVGEELVPTEAPTVVTDEPELLEMDLVAPAGGVVVVRRAFLPIWRAEVDGVAAKPIPAQMTRLAVEVPAGARRLRLFVDRSPLRHGLAVALGAALALALLASRLPRRREPSTP